MNYVANTNQQRRRKRHLCARRRMYMPDEEYSDDQSEPDQGYRSKKALQFPKKTGGLPVALNDGPRTSGRASRASKKISYVESEESDDSSEEKLKKGQKGDCCFLLNDSSLLHVKETPEW